MYWRLETRYNDYSSFYIGVEQYHRSTIMDVNLWPQGTLVKPFYNQMILLTLCYEFHWTPTNSISHLLIVKTLRHLLKKSKCYAINVMCFSCKRHGCLMQIYQCCLGFIMISIPKVSVLWTVAITLYQADHMVAQLSCGVKHQDHLLYLFYMTIVDLWVSKLQVIALRSYS